MKKIILTIFLLLSPFTPCFAIGQNGQVDLPDNINISVELNMEQDGSGSITLTNLSKSMLTTFHPFASRNALTFIVMDQFGNIIKPMGLAKIDPAFKTINLPVKKSSFFKFRDLSFITGTGKFGYNLQKGETYHIIAIYRPSGLERPGFCSREKIIKIIK